MFNNYLLQSTCLINNYNKIIISNYNRNIKVNNVKIIITESRRQILKLRIL